MHIFLHYNTVLQKKIYIYLPVLDNRLDEMHIYL